MFFTTIVQRLHLIVKAFYTILTYFVQSPTKKTTEARYFKLSDWNKMKIYLAVVIVRMNHNLAKYFNSTIVCWSNNSFKYLNKCGDSRNLSRMLDCTYWYSSLHTVRQIFTLVKDKRKINCSKGKYLSWMKTWLNI